MSSSLTANGLRDDPWLVYFSGKAPPKRKKAATLWEQLVILMGGQELELPLNKIALQTN